MGWLSKLFSSELPQADLSALGTDIHSHLIPGIDDGSVSIEDSVNLIRGLRDLGYKKLITTPHIMSDFYRNTPEVIYKGLEDVREALKKEQIDVQLEAAAEYYCDMDFEKSIDRGNLMTFSGKFIL